MADDYGMVVWQDKIRAIADKDNKLGQYIDTIVNTIVAGIMENRYTDYAIARRYYTTLTAIKRYIGAITNGDIAIADKDIDTLRKECNKYIKDKGGRVKLL